MDTLFRAAQWKRAGRGTGVDVESSTEALLEAAARGSQEAWDLLVDRYNRLVWSIARSFRLSDADAADVCQTTWLRLVERLSTIADPDRLAGWLATTTRREAIRVLHKQDREAPLLDGVDEIDEDEQHNPEAQAIVRDEYRELWNAFAALSERCRILLRVLAVSPLDSYAQVAKALGMAVGSIGPTRARCLDRLRAHLAT
jgi:RNA polymerase sigma factor (sigma-70 family)